MKKNYLSVYLYIFSAEFGVVSSDFGYYLLNLFEIHFLKFGKKSIAQIVDAFL